MGSSSSTYLLSFSSELEFSTLFHFPSRSKYEFVRDEIAATRNESAIAQLLGETLNQDTAVELVRESCEKRATVLNITRF